MTLNLTAPAEPFDGNDYTVISFHAHELSLSAHAAYWSEGGRAGPEYLRHHRESLLAAFDRLSPLVERLRAAQAKTAEAA
jgi:hypothetical protein